MSETVQVTHVDTDGVSDLDNLRVHELLLNFNIGIAVRDGKPRGFFVSDPLWRQCRRAVRTHSIVRPIKRLNEPTVLRKLEVSWVFADSPRTRERGPKATSELCHDKSLDESARAHVHEATGGCERLTEWHGWKPR